MAKVLYSRSSRWCRLLFETGIIHRPLGSRIDHGLHILYSPSICQKKPKLTPNKCVLRLFRPRSQTEKQSTFAFCTVQIPKCWNCLEEFSSYTAFCNKCNSLQPLNTLHNYFDVLKVDKKFGLDTKQLTKTFRNLQVHFHPDKFSLKSQKEQHYALEHSSQINKAYRCLLHPVERALYLLELAGQPLHEGQIDMDPEFLMEIMEINEELAEATDKETVQEIGQKNQKILDSLLKEADAAFLQEDIESARQVVAKIKYYNNIYEKVQEYERRHGIIY